MECFVFMENLLLGTPFFRKHPYYTKTIPKPQVLEHFFGVTSLYNHPLEWPIIGPNLWAQETPRPPARVPMRYTKRSWNLVNLLMEEIVSGETQTLWWYWLFVWVILSGLGDVFVVPTLFEYEHREKTVKKSRSCEEQDLLVNLPRIFIVLLCVCFLGGNKLQWDPNKNPWEWETSEKEKPNGGGKKTIHQIGRTWRDDWWGMHS